MLAIILEILGDLCGQFACRFKDQTARHAGAGAPFGEHVDHRKNEACGLAGAGLRDADQVLAHQYRRDRTLLDRGRDIVTAVSNGAKQRIG